MGRRQKRKRERQRTQRDQRTAFAPFEAPEPEPSFDTDYGFMLLADRRPNGAVELTCATCHEFVEDGELGRGTCLHPGSGILSPWHDTNACDFHTRRRK